MRHAALKAGPHELKRTRHKRWEAHSVIVNGRSVGTITCGEARDGSTVWRTSVIGSGSAMHFGNYATRDDAALASIISNIEFKKRLVIL